MFRTGLRTGDQADWCFRKTSFLCLWDHFLEILTLSHNISWTLKSICWSVHRRHAAVDWKGCSDILWHSNLTPVESKSLRCVMKCYWLPYPIFARVHQVDWPLTSKGLHNLFQAHLSYSPNLFHQWTISTGLLLVLLNLGGGPLYYRTLRTSKTQQLQVNWKAHFLAHITSNPQSQLSHVSLI